jgi:hypothetical protein
MDRGVAVILLIFLSPHQPRDVGLSMKGIAKELVNQSYRQFSADMIEVTGKAEAVSMCPVKRRPVSSRPESSPTGRVRESAALEPG